MLLVYQTLNKGKGHATRAVSVVYYVARLYRKLCELWVVLTVWPIQKNWGQEVKF